MVTLNHKTKELIKVSLLVDGYGDSLGRMVLSYQVKKFDVLEFDLQKGTIKLEPKYIKKVICDEEGYEDSDKSDNLNKVIVECKIKDIDCITVYNNLNRIHENIKESGSDYIEEHGKLYTYTIYGDLDKERVLMDRLKSIQERYHGVLANEKSYKITERIEVEY